MGNRKERKARMESVKKQVYIILQTKLEKWLSDKTGEISAAVFNKKAREIVTQIIKEEKKDEWNFLPKDQWIKLVCDQMYEITDSLKEKDVLIQESHDITQPDKFSTGTEDQIKFTIREHIIKCVQNRSNNQPVKIKILQEWIMEIGTVLMYNQGSVERFGVKIWQDMIVNEAINILKENLVKVPASTSV
jgi:hypothetical protein